MSRARFLATLAAQVPWTAVQLLAESALLASVAKRRARAGEHPWGVRHERIGPGWLTGVLRSGGALSDDAEVEAVALQRFGEVGQMSAVFRIQPTYRQGVTGPQQLVLKCTAAEMKNRVLNATFGVFDTEIRSYQLPQPANGLLRPRCWYAAQHPLTKSSMLVLDDLSALRGVPENTKLSSRDALRVAIAVAQHHAHWWQPAGKQNASLQKMGFKTTVDNTRDTLGPMCSMAWGKARKVMAPLVDADIVELLGNYVAHQDVLAQRMMAGATTLIHGDLNTNNLFFDDAGNRVCAIDWQSTHTGHWAEDLAYISQMCLSEEDIAAHEEAIIAAHQRVLAEQGVAIDAAQHRAEYALGLFKVGAMLIMAALIIDPAKDPALYERYKESISIWAAGARRHQLATILAAVVADSRTGR